MVFAAVLPASPAMSSADELRWEGGSWTLETLVLGGAGSGDEALLFDFAGADAVPGSVGFVIGEGTLDVEFRGVLLRFDGAEGAVAVSGGPAESGATGLSRLGEFADKADDAGWPVWIDMDRAGVFSGDAVIGLSFPPQSGEGAHTLLFANSNEEEQMVSALVIKPSGTTAAAPVVDLSLSAADNSGAGHPVEWRDDPRFPLPVPAGPPPPHPYLAMDAEGRLLEAPGRPREGPGGRLHSRPGIVRVFVADPPGGADSREPAE